MQSENFNNAIQKNRRKFELENFLPCSEWHTHWLQVASEGVASGGGEGQRGRTLEKFKIITFIFSLVILNSNESIVVIQNKAWNCLHIIGKG